MKFVCKVCGYIHEGEAPLEQCPKCKQFNVFKPVSDIYYYAAAVAAMLGLLITLIDLMLSYNLLATRPLPQFELYKGFLHP